MTQDKNWFHWNGQWKETVTQTRNKSRNIESEFEILKPKIQETPENQRVARDGVLSLLETDFGTQESACLGPSRTWDPSGGDTV